MGRGRMKWLRGATAAVALVAFGAAQAQDNEVVVEHRSAAGTIAADTLYGGLAGAAVGGGIILYQTQINNQHNYDWGKTLAIATGVGLGAGLVLGIINAASGPNYAASAVPVEDGLSWQAQHPSDMSGTTVMPLRAGTW